MKRNLRTFVPLAVVLILGCHALSVAASAIPMWEFLSRDEKMSYLYRVFSQQVTQFCGDSSMPDCNKNLLVSGLRNLANMDDSALDKLDPYQRGAKEIIWHAMVKNTFSTRLGHGSDGSYFTTGTDSLATSDSDTNGIADETMVVHDYIRPSEHTGPYLVGPMVIRVYPDGRPVPEDTTRPLPRDEDVEEFKHPRLPSIEEVQVNRDTTYREKQSKGNLFPETKSHQRSYEESVHPRNDYPPFKRRLFQEVIAKRKLHYY